MTASVVLQKLKEMSRLFVSGQPPVHIDGLAQEFDMSSGELAEVLSELERRGDIQLVDGLVVLTEIGRRQESAEQ
jgi:predicted Rossmann fold nucleotide-binding protein DprA/Smf involved in DNA uptake